MKQNASDQMEQLAHHEAGHACMLLLLNKKFNYAVVKENDAHVSGAGASFNFTVEAGNEFLTREIIEMLMVLFAGHASEEILRRGQISWHPESSDLKTITGYLEIMKLYLCKGADMDILSSEIHTLTKRKLQQNWKRVKKIARELLKKKYLTYNEIIKL